MTLNEAITKADNLKPNQYKYPEKVSWISDVDGMIYNELVKHRESDELVEWSPYTDETDVSTELLAKEPFAELYIFYIHAKVDYFNGEFTRYANNMQSFNDKYQAFTNNYVRTHMPLGVKKFKV